MISRVVAAYEGAIYTHRSKENQQMIYIDVYANNLFKGIQHSLCTSVTGTYTVRQLYGITLSVHPFFCL